MARFIRDAIVTIVILIVIACIVAYAATTNGGFRRSISPGASSARSRDGCCGCRFRPTRRRRRIHLPARPTRGATPRIIIRITARRATGRMDAARRTTAIDYPKVPDLAAAPVQRLSDGALFYIIQNGVRWTGMPGWKTEHTAEETWKPASYMWHAPDMLPAPPAENHDHDHAHEHKDDHDPHR